MKRERATALLEEVLRNAATGVGWPLEIVDAVYVFGSYARGAVEPGDVDIAINISRTSLWRSYFAECLSYGRDPYGVLRIALRGGRRGVSFLFDPHEGHDDVPMTVLWRRGESISVALDRLRKIPVDPEAGRASRDAMLPCFDGLDRWLPRYLRQELIGLVEENAISIEQVVLDDAEIAEPWLRRAIGRRWTPSSPLSRAAHATLAHLVERGVDLHGVHLHGQDLDAAVTPYYVGFELRYFSVALRCFADHGGVEWLEVVHPTRTGPMLALRVRPADVERLAQHTTNWMSYFG